MADSRGYESVTLYINRCYKEGKEPKQVQPYEKTDLHKQYFLASVLPLPCIKVLIPAEHILPLYMTRRLELACYLLYLLNTGHPNTMFIQTLKHGYLLLDVKQ